jgi:hypothetical protein
VGGVLKRDGTVWVVRGLGELAGQTGGLLILSNAGRPRCLAV